MPENTLEQFTKKNYLNIETFRKSGAGVKTPVWFVEQDGVLYVHTQADSGKVKRIRNKGLIRIVPCTSSGKPTGEWVEAQAQLEAGMPERVKSLFKQKYGLQHLFFFDFLGRIARAEHTTIAIRAIKSPPVN